MAITRDTLEQQIAGLRTVRDEAVGALRFAEYLLSQLDNPVPGDSSAPAASADAPQEGEDHE